MIDTRRVVTVPLPFVVVGFAGCPAHNGDRETWAVGDQFVVLGRDGASAIVERGLAWGLVPWADLAGRTIEVPAI